MEIDLERLKMALGNLVLQQILLETKVHELQSLLEEQAEAGNS